MLIALTGAAGSGKDSAAQILNRYYGFVRTAFADPLKASARVKFGLSVWHTDTQEGKATFLPEFGMSVRDILQREGTEATKPVFGNDFWVKRWLRTYSELREEGADYISLTDLRFPEEADEVLNQGGWIIRMVRPHHDNNLDVTQRQHASEQALDEDFVDFNILNDGTLEDLERKLVRVFETIVDEESHRGF